MVLSRCCIGREVGRVEKGVVSLAANTCRRVSCDGLYIERPWPACLPGARSTARAAVVCVERCFRKSVLCLRCIWHIRARRKLGTPCVLNHAAASAAATNGAPDSTTATGNTSATYCYCCGYYCCGYCYVPLEGWWSVDVLQSVPGIEQHTRHLVPGKRQQQQRQQCVCVHVEPLLLYTQRQQ